MNIRFNLPNGWTLSIAPEIPAAVCSVAAYQTDASDRELFVFDEAGRQELRCYDIDDLLAAIDAVRKAPQS